MNVLRRFALVWILALCILPSRVSVALDFGDVFRAMAIGFGVTAAPTTNNIIIVEPAAYTLLPMGAVTNVVPVWTVDKHGYLRASPVAVPAWPVSYVEPVFPYYAPVYGNVYRVMQVNPSGDVNLVNFQQIPVVGLTTLVNVPIAGAAPRLVLDDIDANDVLRATAIGAAITTVGGPLYDFINWIYGDTYVSTTYVTSVVPRIIVGERVYVVGGIRVAGPRALAGRVKVAYVDDDLFDDGRYSVKLIVPGKSVKPLKFRRFKHDGAPVVINAAVPARAGKKIERANAPTKQARASTDSMKHEGHSNGNGQGDSKHKGMGNGGDKNDNHARGKKHR